MKKLLILCAVVLVVCALLPVAKPPSEQAQSEVVVPSRTPWFLRRGHAKQELTPIPEAASPPVGEIEAFKLTFDKYEGTGEKEAACRENLSRRLKEDPAFMAEALEYMRAETNACFMVCLGNLIAQDSAEARDKVSQVAIGLIEGNESTERRQTAMSLLSYLPCDPKLVQTAGRAAQGDADLQLRTTAIDTLGAWLRQSYGRPVGGMVEAAEQENKNIAGWELIQAINASDDAQINEHGLRVLASQGALLTADVFNAMPGLFQRDFDSANRLLAASVLGLASDDAKDFALKQLEQFYLQEKDSEAKQAIANQMIHLAKRSEIEGPN